MIDLTNLVNSGFRICDRGGRFLDVSMLTLKTAVESYFSTYQSMKYSLHVFDGDSDLEQVEIDYQHRSPYFTACTEAIFHFQHFVELFIKEILRKEHPLLATDASSKPLMLYKLLKKEKIPSSEQELLKSIEFSEAFTRLMYLLNEGKIKGTRLDFVKTYKEPLEKLNLLRNRMWHRGTFILRYTALDEFVGKYILPFITQVFTIPKFSHSVDLWKYANLHCKIDPIIEISNSFQKNTYNIGKIALLKELGRAAYANPLRRGPFYKHFDEGIRIRAERIAEGEAKGPDVERVSICPVCGVRSLVIYNETCSNADDLVEGEVLEEPYRQWRYTWQVKCMCCSFELYNIDIENPSTYGLPIEDYWQTVEIKGGER